LFYRYGFDSCLEIEPKTAAFGSLAPGLGDTLLAASVDARHRQWSDQLPEEPDDLWNALAALGAEQQQALFAHCVSLTVNAVNEAYNRRPRAIAHADRLAEALSLDIAATGWAPSVDNFLGRVTKARILDAVREARGEGQARRIEMLKKGEMATQAEQMLGGSGWLPEPLRTPRRAQLGSQTFTTATPNESTVEETAAIESETAIDEIALEDEAEDASADEAQEVAAE
jgi:ParB family transcriptional regulator, chromosome partitioning protein